MKHIINDLVQRYPVLSVCSGDIKAAFELLEACYNRDGVLYLCGNGGSAADAEHIVAELMKSFVRERKVSGEWVADVGDLYISDHLEGALRAVALTCSSTLATAFANDVAADLVFAQQVQGYARPGDVVWGLSTSGNSANVLHALKVARAKGCTCLGLSGQDGGAMVGLCDVCIRVPEQEVYKIQELHLPVYHALCRMLEERFFR